ncbi:MAG: DUF4153 domain-containing protein [Bacteroidaceae bacterium]|nr:DUF4153 domain-containing protein [Bacteroidaceae bacterium]
MNTTPQQLKETVREGRKAFRQTEAAQIIQSHKNGVALAADEREKVLAEAHSQLSAMESYLRETYPTLTDEDIELCLLSALQCKAKTCSDCLTVSEEAIRVRKHRLKSKLPREVMDAVWEERPGARLLKTLFVKDTMQNVFRRFPLSIFFLTLLTICLLWMLWGNLDNDNARIFASVAYSLSLGVVVATTLKLWGEEVKKKSVCLWVTAIALVLLALNGIYVYKHSENDLTIAFWMMQASIVVALIVAFFFLPFFRDKDDLPAWNFTWRTILWLGISFLTGGILTAGLTLLISSLDMLFGIKVSENCLATIAILGILTTPLLLFLARIPEGEEKHSGVAFISKFLLFVIRYLFVPLLALYLIVLYVYGFRILFRWELPDGGVAWLVSTLMIGCVVVEMGLYPLMRSGEGKPYERWIVRWLPLLILPLLLLMTVGTLRRLSDYGVTPLRLYLLLFNLWCYAVCAGLFLGKAKRIRWIVTSFAAAFLLTSVLPVNFTNMSLQMRRKAFFKLTEGSLPSSFPLDENAAREWIGTIEDEDLKRNIVNEVRFFKKTDAKAVEDILAPDAISYLSYIPTAEANDAVSQTEEEQTIMLQSNDILPVDIPEGYTKVLKRNVWSEELGSTERDGFWINDVKDSPEAKQIFIDMETLKSARYGEDYPRFYSADSTRVFVVKYFFIKLRQDSILPSPSTIQGYVFSK